ncbi:MAG: fructosamine kinase family protein [Fimbriimonadales bacterium]|nr:fructosamine kinase family protein [Fimbriimonadales bacterium]
MEPSAPWDWPALLRRLARACPDLPTVVGIERMHGGMVHHVFELSLANGGAVVLKVSEARGDPFGRERAELDHLSSSGALPCPRALACEPTGREGPAFLAMDRLPGANWAEAPTGPEGDLQVEEHLAELLLSLHRRTGPGFCRFGEEPAGDWLEVFGPMLEHNLRKAERRLPSDWVAQAGGILRRLPKFWQLGGRPVPRLVHGDVWATNVVVHRSGGRWRVSGLVDPALHFADEEYEIAYLECFRTAGDAFFRLYRAERPERDGYPVRRLCYWLNTMLLHVHAFGDAHYVRRTGGVLRALGTA